MEVAFTSHLDVQAKATQMASRNYPSSFGRLSRMRFSLEALNQPSKTPPRDDVFSRPLFWVTVGMVSDLVARDDEPS